MFGTTRDDWLPSMCSGICTFGPEGLAINGIEKDTEQDLTKYPKQHRTKKWMISQMLHCGEDVDEEKLSLEDVQEKFKHWGGWTNFNVCYTSVYGRAFASENFAGCHQTWAYIIRTIRYGPWSTYLIRTDRRFIPSEYISSGSPP
jgi:hypothetical protein